MNTVKLSNINRFTNKNRPLDQKAPTTVVEEARKAVVNLYYPLNIKRFVKLVKLSNINRFTNWNSLIDASEAPEAVQTDP